MLWCRIIICALIWNLVLYTLYPSVQYLKNKVLTWYIQLWSCKPVLVFCRNLWSSQLCIDFKPKIFIPLKSHILFWKTYWRDSNTLSHEDQLNWHKYPKVCLDIQHNQCTFLCFCVLYCKHQDLKTHLHCQSCNQSDFVLLKEVPRK